MWGCVICASVLAWLSLASYAHTAASTLTLPPPTSSPRCSTREVDWSTMRTDPGKGVAAAFTPYNILPGGGERYLLSAVAALQKEGYFVHVLVEAANACKSTAQLLEVAAKLRVEVDPDRVALKTVTKDHATRTIDAQTDLYSVFFALGNEKAPLVHNVGHVGFFMCQFPFDLDRPVEDVDVSAISSFDHVLLNSRFTTRHYDRFARRLIRRAIRENGTAPQVDILYPPVTPFKRAPSDGRKDVVLLGRFFEGRQAKGHAAAIETFRAILPSLPGGTRLRFVGSLMRGHEPYVERLRKLADGLPVTFDVDAPKDVLEGALRGALVQIHMTGADGDERDPASEEHFGLAVAEGSSTGAIPVVLDRGGLGDIVTNGANGFLEKTPSDIGKRTIEVFRMSAEGRRALGDRAADNAMRFTDEKFFAGFSKLLRRARLTKPVHHLVRETRSEVYARPFDLKKGSKKVLVIIEPRVHWAFEYAVKNALYHNPGWKLVVVHGLSNEDFVHEALSNVRGVEYLRLDRHTMDIADLNKMLLDHRFWDRIDAEKAIMFQTDSLFLGSADEFTAFDYIGAPWAVDNERSRALGDLVPDGAGNGGLSLRSVRKMREITRRLREKPSGKGQEDLIFSVALGLDSESVMPTRGEAYDFSREVPIPGLDKHARRYPAAIHALWYYYSDTPERFAELLDFLEVSVCGIH
jgi:glycosyltransferase involved in cell wall biosynthesis